MKTDYKYTHLNGVTYEIFDDRDRNNNLCWVIKMTHNLTGVVTAWEYTDRDFAFNVFNRLIFKPGPASGEIGTSSDLEGDK